MTDRLAAAFQRAARGAATASDDRVIAAVLDQQHGQPDRASIEQGAAERYGAALAAAIRAGTPRLEALQGFVGLLKAGRLRETVGVLVFEPDRAAHPMTTRIAEQALRIALASAGATHLSVRSTT